MGRAHDTGLLIGGPDHAGSAGDARRPGRARVLVAVKAAPNPSSTYGETVCVAGLRLDLQAPGWICLYPINFRALTDDHVFSTYDVIDLAVRPVTEGSDSRHESWRPDTDTVSVVERLPSSGSWARRRRLLDPWAIDATCALAAEASENPRARSLGLVRPVDVGGLDMEPHPGWSSDEQAKIDRYVSQLSLVGPDDRTPLEAPRYVLRYRYRCASRRCRGHRQQLLDWEVVALQRRLRGATGDEARAALSRRFLDEMCGPTRDPAFFLGNQAKRRRTFSVLGVFWPPRQRRAT